MKYAVLETNQKSTTV